MKKKCYILFIILLINSQDYAQSIKKSTGCRPLDIYYKEFNLWIYPRKLPDTITKKINQTTKITIYVKNCKGYSDFYTTDKMDKIVLKGSYSEALDTFKTYVSIIDASASSKITVKKYFQPVKDGEWIYYSKRGVVIKKEKYIKGDVP